MSGAIEIFLTHEDVAFLKKHLILDTRLERLLRQGQRRTDGINLRGSEDELKMLDELIIEQLHKHDMIVNGLEKISGRVQKTLFLDYMEKNADQIAEGMTGTIDPPPEPAEDPEDVEACMLLVTPREPALAWLRTLEPSPETLEPSDWGKSAYLISYAVDQKNLDDWLRESFVEIFDNELLPFAGGAPDDAPECTSYEMFREWFDVELVEIVYDVRPVEDDDDDDMFGDDPDDIVDLDDDDDDDEPRH